MRNVTLARRSLRLVAVTPSTRTSESNCAHDNALRLSPSPFRREFRGIAGVQWGSPTALSRAAPRLRHHPCGPPSPVREAAGAQGTLVLQTGRNECARGASVRLVGADGDKYKPLSYVKDRSLFAGFGVVGTLMGEGPSGPWDRSRRACRGPQTGTAREGSRARMRATDPSARGDTINDMSRDASHAEVSDRRRWLAEPCPTPAERGPACAARPADSQASRLGCCTPRAGAPAAVPSLQGQARRALPHADLAGEPVGRTGWPRAPGAARRRAGMARDRAVGARTSRWSVSQAAAAIPAAPCRARCRAWVTRQAALGLQGAPRRGSRARACQPRAPGAAAHPTSRSPAASSVSRLRAAGRECCRRGQPIPATARPEARYCSRRCRQAASRARLAGARGRAPSRAASAGTSTHRPARRSRPRVQ